MDAYGLQVLKSSDLFSELSESELNLLAAVFRKVTLGEGATVFLEHMPGESLYLIQNGGIKISRMRAEGDEKILAVLGVEDSFGELALIDGGAREVTARVAEGATLLSLHKADFDAFCLHNPHIGIKLMRNIVKLVAHRMRDNHQEYMAMLSMAIGQFGGAK